MYLYGPLVVMSHLDIMIIGPLSTFGAQNNCFSYVKIQAEGSESLGNFALASILAPFSFVDSPSRETRPMEARNHFLIPRILFRHKF